MCSMIPFLEPFIEAFYFLYPLLLFLLISTQTPQLSSMETLQHLSNESFSYSWLTNIKPSIEMDSDLISVHRTSMSDAYDFDFGLPSSHSPVLVHADEIISNGLLLPLHLIILPKSESVSESSDSVLSRSLSLDSSESFLSLSNRYQPRNCCDVPSPLISSESFPIFHSAQSTPISRGAKFKLPFLRNCARKYLCFLLPLCKKVKRLRLLSSKPVRSSPRTSNGFSTIEWCRGNTVFDMGAESSIYEAVLHCKKSIGQVE